MKPLCRLLISDARAILKGHVVTFTFDKEKIGTYFLVEDVKKKDSDKFLLSGTGCGKKYGLILTAAQIIWLSEHRFFRCEFTSAIDGKQLYEEYVLC